jgi:hypothetical protein
MYGYIKYITMAELYSNHEYVDNINVTDAWDENYRGIARLCTIPECWNPD